MGWLQDLINALTGGHPKPPVVTPPVPVPVPVATAPAVIALMNRERARKGYPPLVEDPAIDADARDWAVKMAGGLGLTHGDFQGRSAAYFPGGNFADAEDVAEGQPDAASVVAAWMSSAFHRANILGDYTHAGVGSATDPRGSIYWSAIFDKQLW